MTSSYFNISKYLLVAGILFCCKLGYAQSKYERLSFKIDSFANVGLPKSALKVVDQLDDLARKNNDAPQQIRAVIYRMTFQSYLEENALVAVISRLKTDVSNAGYPVKPVLQSLLAQMYWNYYQQNRWQFNQRSRLANPDSSFVNWDLQTIITQTSHLYESSLMNAGREQTTPVGVLDGVLDGDKNTRYLRPTLYDLLVQRAFDFFLSDEAGLTRPKMPFTINDPRFFGDSHSFAGLDIKTIDTASIAYKGIKYLQAATTFHLQKKDEEALADLDLKRLGFLHDKSTLPQKDSLYLKALRKIATDFAAKPISADALVLQGQYYQAIDSLAAAYGFFKRAVNAFPESMGGKNAAVLIKQIEERELSATVEDVNMPDKPILGLLNYRNVNSAKIFIYRLSDAQLIKYEGRLDLSKDAGYNNILRQQKDIRKSQMDFLQKLIPIRTSDVKWSNPGDYKKHSLEFKIDALTAGNYVLLVKNGNDEAGNLVSLADFKITGLAYTMRGNPDGKAELRIMNRETGSPLNGVKINLSNRTYSYDESLKKSVWNEIDEDGISGKNGVFYSNKFSIDNNVTVKLISKGDTLTDDSKNVYGAKESTDNSDDPVDKTVLFTDRQIYRPGQAIYFKGLQLQVNKGKNKIMPGKDEEVDFLDVNNKQVSTLKLKTNEFGTFSGSFIIPQSMLNGDVTIKTEDVELEVKVEEYKRPTFQIEFSPVKESYKLNDSVTVKGNVTAFSGYGLSQTRVAYHIIRTAGYSYGENIGVGLRRSKYRYINSRETEIKTDTIITDDQGKFNIKFKAVTDDADGNSGMNYNYSISADATDASGETRSAQTSVTIGNNDIKIVNTLPDLLFSSDSIKAAVSITNLNGQAQRGTVKIEVYSLKGNDGVFKDRLWSKPDEFNIDKPAFKNDFPFYAYGNEDEVITWPTVKKIIGLNLNVDTANNKAVSLDELKKQNPGRYKVIISARNGKGDTTSITQYVKLISKQATAPVTFNDWIVPVLNEVRPGDTAKFIVGINQKVSILMERYSAAKLISSKWITINGGQQLIDVPIADTDKNVAVQFMMVCQNRMLTSYQPISIIDPDKNLKIKFLTFHNKLQPGQKEQWKLQISGPNNEKAAAEMLAGLYDASLDDITPAQSWTDGLTAEGQYLPNYFAWVNYGFVNPVITEPITRLENSYGLLTRDYERLNLFGYDYFGGYNGGYQRYLQQVQNNLQAAKRDKILENDYFKNAGRVKNGYDITGRVIDEKYEMGMPGVEVSIKGTKIKTTTNSKGYFKIKVPVDAKLLFSNGYADKEIQTSKTETLTIKLKLDPLNEVQIVGYSAQTSREVTGATIRIRGMVSNQLLEGKVAGLSVADSAVPAPMQNAKLKDEAKGNGINVNKPQTPITPRTNFNETAFFYPQLHTNEKGEILIDFTIPEALTRWKFRGLATTKDLQTGYIENTVVTQKQLSISANTPRFLREGDTITISARLANLTDKPLKGKVQMELFNALNMQKANLFADKSDANQSFEIKGNSTQAVSFRLIVPAGLDALTYRLTADAGQYTDGEENTLPVLPNRMLVTESMPMMVRPGQTKDFTFDKLVNQNSTTLKNKTLTLEYTQNPAWYAVQALPYMMEFPYECSEQIFSRYYANSLATSLVNKLPAIKQVFDQWKASNSVELLSNLEKNQELKSTLIEETPWLKDAMSESEQKKRIALLFDLNKMSDELKLNLDKLQKRQLPNGGFTWFGGNDADRYITQHIAEGMGELYHLGIAANQPGLDAVANNAISYLDNQIVTDDKLRKNKKDANLMYSDIDIHAWFTRSYFLDKPLSSDLKNALNTYLKWAQDEWTYRSVYDQGMIALTLQRYGKPAVTAQIEKSLLETGQQSDELGMYWAKNQQGYFWYESPVETQSLLIELFTEAGDNQKAVDEMKIWLLRNKQTNDWKTTKATASACYALLLKGSDLLADNGNSTIKLDGKQLTDLKPDTKADAGTCYIKTSWIDEQIKPSLGNIEVKNNSSNISWGALHWQYLENLDKITSSQTNIHLERKYFIQQQTSSGAVLTPVDATHQPKTGDLLKVVVYLKADRDFEYVQLKDLRPAGTEPVDAISEYKYQDGLSYYQVTKDVATNFFISYLNKGNYVFEYRLRVAQPGNFSTGITSVQSMYAPEFNAHSQGGRMTIK